LVVWIVGVCERRRKETNHKEHLVSGDALNGQNEIVVDLSFCHAWIIVEGLKDVADGEMRKGSTGRRGKKMKDRPEGSGRRPRSL